MNEEKFEDICFSKSEQLEAYKKLQKHYFRKVKENQRLREITDRMMQKNQNQSMRLYTLRKELQDLKDEKKNGYYDALERSITKTVKERFEKEKAILSCLTGKLLCDYDLFHKTAEEILGRTIFKNEINSEGLRQELETKSFEALEKFKKGT